MREILFRGKSPITKEWAYGDLFQHGEQRFIMADGHNVEVDPESVGQYTGCEDESGVKIFEGDMVRTTIIGVKYKVVWEEVYSAFFLHKGKLRYGLSNVNGKYYQIIGNIHDNPELIEDGET